MNWTPPAVDLDGLQTEAQDSNMIFSSVIIGKRTLYFYHDILFYFKINFPLFHVIRIHCWSLCVFLPDWGRRGENTAVMYRAFEHFAAGALIGRFS